MRRLSAERRCQAGPLWGGDVSDEDLGGERGRKPGGELGRTAQQEPWARGGSKRGQCEEWRRTSGARRGERRGSKGTAAGPLGATRAAVSSSGAVLRHDEERGDPIYVTLSKAWL